MSEKKDGLQLLSERIRLGDEDAFEKVFQIFFAKLCLFANGYVNSLDISRDIVQEVYANIWYRHEAFEINQCLKSYLYRAVRNESLDYLNKMSQIEKLKEDFSNNVDWDESFEKKDYPKNELIEKVWQVVDEMPEKRRSIFILYRKHGLTYQEISEVMDISSKTVENQLANSLKFIREKLQL